MVPHPLLVSKAAGNLINTLVSAAGIQTDIHNQPLDALHFIQNLVQTLLQVSFGDPFKLRDEEIAVILVARIHQ